MVLAMPFNYEKELVESLEKQPWLRHLFHQKGKEVVVILDDNVKIRGRLRTIDYIRGKINLEVEVGEEVAFINWRYVKFLKGEAFKEE